MAAVRVLVLLVVAVLSLSARAATPVEEAQMAELERSRGEIAGEVHLQAYDLIDELAYGWLQEPVFTTPTPVVLAGVSVPVGLGTGMQALLENHISAVLTANPRTNIQLVHCPSCTAVVVHSGPQGTVVSRGYDNPAVLAELGEGTGRHALFVDVEAEGAWLVLRARITRLTPELPIVWSHTLATSASTPSLLRQSDDLKSAAEARAEYLDVLEGRGPVSIPFRIMVRSYARPWSDDNIGAPPFVWAQTGVELGATGSKAWTSSALLGVSFIPQAYQGLMAQARVSRLITGKSRSLTRPDLYGFLGAAVISVWGPATTAFQETPITADDVLTAADGDSFRTSFGALHIGADLRLGNRMGFSMFLETVPAYAGSSNLGEFVYFATISFQTIGTEVTFWF